MAAAVAAAVLAYEVLATLGRWVEFRPDFARLPANLAAAFRDDPALLQRLLGSGFVPGLTPTSKTLGGMPALTSVLLNAFDAPGAHETLGEAHVVTPPDPAGSHHRTPPGS